MKDWVMALPVYFGKYQYARADMAWDNFQRILTEEDE
jgi:hypothetical protein